MDQCACVGFVGGSGLGPVVGSSRGDGCVCMAGGKAMKSKTAGFKDNFLPEIGVRGPGSRPKFDLRPKSLRPVEQQLCGMCGGTGQTLCSICEGVSNVRVDGTALPCGKCGGTNVVSCGNCRGTGALPELVKGWEYKLESMFRRG